MDKYLSAKYYYQDNKERLKKNFKKNIKVFLQKEKSDNMVMNNTKIYQKM